MAMNLKGLVGTSFEGFRLTALLGEGGMAVVYRGENLLNPRIVRAIKIIRPELAEVPEFRARFAEEAGLLSRLHHPNVVRFHGVRMAALATSSVLAMELELLEGNPLDEVLRRAAGRPISAQLAAGLMLQAVEGVGAAHELGIVHRDLKPANLFVLRDGAVKVLDFGIARAIDDVDRHQHLTRVGTVPGSPPYMAPEVCNGALPAAQADVYALGITLLEVLLGYHPYNPPGQPPRSSTQMMMAHLTQALPPVSFRRSDVPASLSTAVERATAKEPSQRYPDAGRFAEALRAALRDFTVMEGAGARPAPPPPPRASTPGVPGAVRPSSPSAPPRPSSPSAPPLSTEFAVPTLDRASAPAPPSSPAPAATDFAVPTLQKSSTTEPTVTVDGASPRRPAWQWIAPVAVALLTVVAWQALAGKPSEPLAHPAAASTTGAPSDAAGATQSRGGENRWVRIRVPSTPVPLGVAQEATPPSVPGFRPSMRVQSPDADYDFQQHEVTFGELDPWLAQHPDASPGTRHRWIPGEASRRARLPAVGIPWETARRYCDSLGGALPTEEQWEFAARGLALRPHPWGTAALDLQRVNAFVGLTGRLAEFGMNDQDVTPSLQDGQLYDMAGNAREWTVDLYRADVPTAPVDMAWVQANGMSFRAIRGLPALAARPEALPGESATWRDALCATGPCPADAAWLQAQMGFRCARTAP